MLDELAGFDVAVVGHAILLLLDAQNVGGALDAGEENLAIIGLKEFRQGLDALDDHQQIILIAKREDGVNEIMAGALLFQIDFETVGEEGEEVTFNMSNSYIVRVNSGFRNTFLLSLKSQSFETLI